MDSIPIPILIPEKNGIVTPLESTVISLKNLTIRKEGRSSLSLTEYFSPFSPLPKQPRDRQTEEAQVTNWSGAICLSVAIFVSFGFIYCTIDIGYDDIVSIFFLAELKTKLSYCTEWD